MITTRDIRKALQNFQHCLDLLEQKDRMLVFWKERSRYHMKRNKAFSIIEEHKLKPMWEYDNTWVIFGPNQEGILGKHKSLTEALKLAKVKLLT